MRIVPWLGFAFHSLIVTSCGGSMEPPAAPASEPVPTEPRAAVSPPEPSPAPRPAGPARALQERVPESVVQMSFEPLVTGVRPGSRFLLAAHFRIAPGYRISWKLAGDVGKPTSVTFRAPPEFEVGEVQFPAPDRYTVPGGYVGYGYEKEMAVFVEVKAPGNLRRDGVHRFDLEASWVACKGQCASERTAAFVELSTTHGDARASEIEASLAPFRARLPRPLSELKATLEWEIAEKDATLVLKVPGTPHDFFPDGTAKPAPVQTIFAEGEARFRYDEAPRPGSRPLRGVVVATIDGKETSIDIDAPLPDPEGAGEKDGKGKAKGKKESGGARKSSR